MYISLEDSRAKGFMKWADAHPEGLGKARAVGHEAACLREPGLARHRGQAMSQAEVGDQAARPGTPLRYRRHLSPQPARP